MKSMPPRVRRTSQSLTLIGGNQGAYDGVSHTLANLTPTQVEFYVKCANNTLTSGYFVVGQSAYRTNSVFHFRMDASGTMGLTDGPGNFYFTPYVANQWYKIHLQLNWTLRTVDYYVNDSLVMPNIPFCNTSLTALSVLNLYNFDNTQAWWDQINFTTFTSTLVNMIPATTTTFANGLWHGTVTVNSSGTNLTMYATDLEGHAGTSAPFDVLTAVAVVASPSNGGSVTGGGAFGSGSQQTIAAAPNPGWGFTGWQDGNTQNPRVITVPSTNVTYTANFVVRPVFAASTLSWMNQAFTATLNGTSGSNYVILVSTNLKTWTPLTTVQIGGGSTNFTDTNATGPWQFYLIQARP